MVTVSGGDSTCTCVQAQVQVVTGRLHNTCPGTGTVGLYYAHVRYTVHIRVRYRQNVRLIYMSRDHAFGPVISSDAFN